MNNFEDYEIPFDDMSEDEFLYRTMNVNDPMYMGNVEEANPNDFEDWD